MAMVNIDYRVTSMGLTEVFVEFVILRSKVPQEPRHILSTKNRNNINNDIVSKHDTPEKLFQEQNASTFCHARHKELCSKIQGKVMSCSDCQKQFLHLTLSTNLSNSL